MAIIRHIVIARLPRSEQPDYYGPFVSDVAAYQFADHLPVQMDGYPKVRPIITPAPQVTTTRPTPQTV